MKQLQVACSIVIFNLILLILDHFLDHFQPRSSSERSDSDVVDKNNELVFEKTLRSLRDEITPFSAMFLRTDNKPAVIRECSIRESVVDEQAMHIVVLEGKKCAREGFSAPRISCTFTEAFATLLFIGRYANTPLPSNVVENAASDM